jgi:tetratricopeptide (TPR) repeat protein
MHEVRGYTLYHLERRDEAFQAFTKALELDPSRWQSWSVKAEIEGPHRQDWVAAAKSYARAAELRPNDPPALWNLTFAYWKTNDPAVVPAARRYLESVDPNDSEQAEYVAQAHEYLAAYNARPAGQDAP